jgi:ubiquinone/menaquinone biosynthesis C-methylase UbiE
MTLRERTKELFVPIHDNFYVQKEFTITDFEKQYINIRRKEDRLYSDEIVRLLPEYSGKAVLKNEWRVRKSSTGKLLRYLDDKTTYRYFLELGCGNGWLSNHLGKQHTREVIGIDINRQELEQAARVFTHKENITFIHADILTAPLNRGTFDCIVLASCIQYFNDAPALLSRLHELLSVGGEIHILDSPFYSDEEAPVARARSQQYFRAQHSAMEGFYFHHRWKIFDGMNASVLSKPPSKFYSLFSRWIPVRSPFAWIRIRK